VTFDRDVTHCAAQATVIDGVLTPVIGNLGTTNADQIDVSLWSPNYGYPLHGDFALTVNC
jgi:hypothetical protein